MRSQQHLTGTTVRVLIRIYDDLGSPADPDTLALRWKSPETESGWEGPLTYGTDPEVVRHDIGYYTADLPSAGIAGGVWTYRWDATLDGVAAIVSGSYYLGSAD